MPKITYVSPNGARKTLEAKSGASVMRTAVLNDIGGIVAECGASRMCATCHVYVDEWFIDLLPGICPDEDEMLGATACERKSNSRLSCQLPITEELDGLIVFLPESQY